MGALTSKLFRRPPPQERHGEESSSGRYKVTAFTEEDKAWLESAQNSKLLDPLVRVLGVGHRHPHTGRPTVLVCYPLRVAHDPTRADIRGYSKNKWKSKKGQKPVPWPNTFWLVCPETAGLVGQLEHQGLIQEYHARFVSPEVAAELAEARGKGNNEGETTTYSPEDAAVFARQHIEYGEYRWSLLSAEDTDYAEQEGYRTVLRDCGVGGLRFFNQVKCLHLHYAHYLASGGDNLVGRWVQEEIDRQFKNKDAGIASASNS